MLLLAMRVFSMELQMLARATMTLSNFACLSSGGARAPVLPQNSLRWNSVRNRSERTGSSSKLLWERERERAV